MKNIFSMKDDTFYVFFIVFILACLWLGLIVYPKHKMTNHLSSLDDWKKILTDFKTKILQNQLEEYLVYFSDGRQQYKAKLLPPFYKGAEIKIWEFKENKKDTVFCITLMRCQKKEVEWTVLPIIIVKKEKYCLKEGAYYTCKGPVSREKDMVFPYLYRVSPGKNFLSASLIREAIKKCN